MITSYMYRDAAPRSPFPMAAATAAKELCSYRATRKPYGWKAGAHAAWRPHRATVQIQRAIVETIDLLGSSLDVFRRAQRSRLCVWSRWEGPRCVAAVLSPGRHGLSRSTLWQKKLNEGGHLLALGPESMARRAESRMRAQIRHYDPPALIPY